MRTIFCLISISLGISSITLIVASVEGAYQKAYQIIDMFGADSVLIFGGSLSKRAVGKRSKTLTLNDVKAMADAFPQAYFVVPIDVKRGVNVSFKQNKHQTFISASTPEYSAAASWPVVEGRDLSQADLNGRKNVCLLGKRVVDKLFQNTNPIGRFIKVDKILCRVIGILSDRSSSRVGHDINDRIIMPITTVMTKLKNERKYISAIRIRFTEQKYLSYWLEEVKIFLRHQHALHPDEEDDFRIFSADEIIKFLVTLTGSFVLFLGISAIVSLTVSGFVLANLFLLSVSQRKREIGIRRAVGATKRNIFNQFMFEAALITLSGALLGYAIGVLSSQLLVNIGDFPMHFSYRGFLVGLVLSVVVAVVFGIQPAKKAANLSPIEAIR